MQYQRMARRLNLRIEVIVSVGSSVMDALRQHIPPSARTIVGGRHRWWWPQRVERLAAALRRSGRHALLSAKRPPPNESGSLHKAISTNCQLTSEADHQHHQAEQGRGSKRRD
jgi:hypothetical protein